MNSSSLQFVLPVGCTTIGTGTGQVAVVCQPIPEPWYQKLLPSAPALLISMVALVLSYWSFNYNRSKDGRARRQSIIDDYWLRKVVSPVSIEPFLKLTTRLVTDLPTAQDPPEQIKMYWVDQVRQTKDLSVAFSALQLIDEALSKKVMQKLEDLDDHVAQYIGECLKFSASEGDAPDRASSVEAIQAVSIEIFSIIKDHQTIVE